jgi:Iap family predicted aminopeptidase
MLHCKQVIYQVARGGVRNVYITTEEMLDLLSNLTPNEVKLYTVLKHTALDKQITPAFFEDQNLSEKLDVSKATVKKMRSVLKTKGYARIIKFPDEDGTPMVRVVVGKDQVELYNLGVKAEITNARAYKKLLQQFPVTDKSLTQEEREQEVKDLNQYYLDHAHEFK